MKIDILVVDDDDAHRGMLKTMLGSWGYTVDEATDGDEAVDRVREKAFDAVLTDVRMARMDGIHALKGILEYNPALPVVLMTAYSSVETAVEALRLGAYDYLVKPLDFEALKHTLEKAIEHSRLSVENRELRRQLTDAATRPGILGRSQAVKDMLHIISTVAPTEATVLITGESGTGKEKIAHALHYGGRRAGRPFIRVNCSALAESLLESELFGHAKGAFTGADRESVGRFEAAHGGTILLDEIGDISPLIQLKLLRVLEEKEIERVGETTPRKVDVRVLAATHRDLKKAIAEGTFREDLYYRLNVMNIRIPPLRDRVEDIPLLAEHFRLKFNGQYAKSIAGVSTEVMEIFMGHPWPGNVRELEHVIERAFVLCGGEMIRPEHIALEAAARPVQREEAVAAVPADEKQRLLAALEKAAWNISKSARLLGVSRWTLYRRLLRHGLERPGEEL